MDAAAIAELLSPSLAPLAEPPRGERGLPLIVPLVLYQGRERWQYEREFSALFADGESAWRWVPRVEHVLIDQTRQRPETVPGAPPARLAQIAMMAAEET